MPVTTIGVGLALIALGIGGYFATGRASVTALIPAFFGVPLVVLGLLARAGRGRKHCMHAAVALGLLGFLGAGRGLMQLPAMLSGGAEVERPTAVALQSAMAVVCLLYVLTGVVSFIMTRGGSAAASTGNSADSDLDRSEER